jgi:2-polyprenyl-3-methyl-5-hydroxy-6-metoxy-1,4-benzoquinol methylase
MVEGTSSSMVEADHRARYAFASSFCHNKRVLDFACGTGYGSEILSRRQPIEVVGCDNSEEAIAQARQKYHTRRLSFCLVDATNAPFKPGTFDLCVSFETLEHVAAPGSFVRELHRVSAADGLLILSTPNRRVYSPGTRPGGKPWNPYHVKEFLLSELLTLLNSNGFAPLSVYGQHQANLVRVRAWNLVARNMFAKNMVQTLVRSIRGNEPARPGSLFAPGPPPHPEVATIGMLKEPEFFVIMARRR